MESRERFVELVRALPLVSVDLVLVRDRREVLLGLRTNRPAQGSWFVPGGRILKDEKRADALTRVAARELGSPMCTRCSPAFSGPSSTSTPTALPATTASPPITWCLPTASMYPPASRFPAATTSMKPCAGGPLPKPWGATRSIASPATTCPCWGECRRPQRTSEGRYL